MSNISSKDALFSWKAACISVLATSIVCAIRNPISFASPGLYQEEGIYTMQSLKYGFCALLINHNNYLDIIGRMINLAASYVSFEHIPQAALFLYLLINSLFVYQILITAQYRGLCYLSCAFLFLLFPTEPEWVGIPLYSFLGNNIIAVLERNTSQ